MAGNVVITIYLEAWGDRGVFSPPKTVILFGWSTKRITYLSHFCAWEQRIFDILNLIILVSLVAYMLTVVRTPDTPFRSQYCKIIPMRTQELYNESIYDYNPLMHLITTHHAEYTFFCSEEASIGRYTTTEKPNEIGLGIAGIQARKIQVSNIPYLNI